MTYAHKDETRGEETAGDSSSANRKEELTYNPNEIQNATNFFAIIGRGGTLHAADDLRHLAEQHCRSVIHYPEFIEAARRSGHPVKDQVNAYGEFGVSDHLIAVSPLALERLLSANPRIRISKENFSMLAPNKTKKPERFTLTAFKDIKRNTGRNYLVKGLLPKEGLVIIWGEPKCGKSFKTFDLVMHVALGRKYRKLKVQQGAVVYLALEGKGGFVNRIDAWRLHNKIDEETEVPFYLMGTSIDLIADHKQLIHDIKAQNAKPDCVVIDTLNRALNGSENETKDMAAFIRAADVIREEFNCTVIIIHHCGIETKRPRGSTALTGACDAQIKVTRDWDLNLITMEVEMMKDGAEDVKVESQLLVQQLGNDDEGDPISSCVVIPALDEFKGRRVKPRFSDNDSVALAALEAALEKDGIPGESVPGSGRRPTNLSGKKACPVEAWKREFIALKWTSRTSPDTKKRALKRAEKNLTSAGVIGTFCNYVFLTGQTGQGPDK